MDKEQQSLETLGTDAYGNLERIGTIDEIAKDHLNL